ncbi:hypothetical protein M011DRAFT_457228 [Sporormia fimetaria CBS 119925]|uniref:Uncharacterized protein n=1 Tax=Sporormia fimetaria CBS 119925 TaxID=1340428 RepID=A0A6A6VFZ3_9PLEO|nr:hypothetical protein M011DRAFT_457228 [Sporormia fimetaria CBS 119925]
MSLSTATGHLSPPPHALHRESSLSVSTVSGPLSPTSTTFGTESCFSNASTFHGSWTSNASTTWQTDTHTDSWISHSSSGYNSSGCNSSGYVTDNSSWEKAHYLSLTLWDIDREFQKSHEAYSQWLTKNRRKRSRFRRLVSRKKEDSLGRSLRLGRQVQELLEQGIETFGSRFERGDSTCNITLSSLLLRIQHEIRVPLEDCALSRFSMTLPRDDILTAAKGVRRACLQALRDQFTRLINFTPHLPPPRFSVNFCPFAVELQKDPKNPFQTSKLRRHDRYDEREVCPHCNAHIAVTLHSGLPSYRHLLFSSHLSPAPGGERNKATFACKGCYKTFEDSYGFLDHVFQKGIGSERSCQKRLSLTLNTPFQHRGLWPQESEPKLVEKCLRNCIKREATRAKAVRRSKELEGLRLSRKREMESLSRASSVTLVNSEVGREGVLGGGEKKALESVEEDSGADGSVMKRGRGFGRVYFFHTGEYD